MSTVTISFPINGAPAKEHLGRTVAEMVPDIAPEVEKPFRAVFETEQPIYELRIRGSTPKAPEIQRIWLGSVQPLRSCDGVVRHILVRVQEITALEHAEAALRENERILTASQQLSPDSFTILRAIRDGSGECIDFAWVLTDEGEPNVPLDEVVHAALGPFEGKNLRCALNAEASVASNAVVPLTLALNELATNAIKYGALSSAGGRAEVTCEENAGRVTLTWREIGGQAAAPQRKRFESRLIDEVARQLPAGHVTKDFSPEGLRVVVEFESRADRA